MSGARWLPALLWLALVLTLTSIPNPNVPVALAGGDKAAHAIMYGVLGALVASALGDRPRLWSWLIGAWAGIAAIAALDEWHQLFIPGRSASAGDWVADTAGVGFALLVFGVALRRREPIR